MSQDVHMKASKDEGDSWFVVFSIYHQHLIGLFLLFFREQTQKFTEWYQNDFEFSKETREERVKALSSMSGAEKQRGLRDGFVLLKEFITNKYVLSLLSFAFCVSHKYFFQV
jgi:hypothetical protein